MSCDLNEILGLVERAECCREYDPQKALYRLESAERRLDEHLLVAHGVGRICPPSYSGEHSDVNFRIINLYRKISADIS